MLLTRFFPNDWGMGCRVTKKCSGNSNALLPGSVRNKGTAMEQPWNSQVRRDRILRRDHMSVYSFDCIGCAPIALLSSDQY